MTVAPLLDDSLPLEELLGQLSAEPPGKKLFAEPLDEPLLVLPDELLEEPLEDPAVEPDAALLP